jgi:hypothetical protein
LGLFDRQRIKASCVNGKTIVNRVTSCFSGSMPFTVRGEPGTWFSIAID